MNIALPQNKITAAILGGVLMVCLCAIFLRRTKALNITKEEQKKGAPINKEPKNDGPTEEEQKKGAPINKEPKNDGPTEEEQKKGAPINKEPKNDGPTEEEQKKGAPINKEPKNDGPTEEFYRTYYDLKIDLHKIIRNPYYLHSCFVRI